MKKFWFVLLAVLMVATLGMAVGARENASVTAPYFSSAPTIDGVISTAEWGEPTAYAKVTLKRDWYAFDENDNVLVSEYCFMDPSRVLYANDLSFDLWLRWDNQYFYIGVVSKDQYGLATGSTLNTTDASLLYQSIWSGDALQFGIDPAGANSNGNASNPFGQFAANTYCFGYTDNTLSTVAMRNDANKAEEVAGYKGAIKWSDGVWPTFCGEANSTSGYLTYEVAIPYAAFNGSVADGKGNGFGVSVARVSATPIGTLDGTGADIGTGDYECWLSWGDGIMGSIKDQLPEYRCGSNKVVLVDDNATSAAAPAPVVTAAPAEEGDGGSSKPTSGNTESGETEKAETDKDGETVTEAVETDKDGNPVTDAVETDKNGETVTDKAGETSKETDKTGKDTAKETAAETDKASTAKSGSNTGLIIGIIIAVVVVAAVVVVIVVVTKKKK